MHDDTPKQQQPSSGNGKEIWVRSFTEESAQEFREQVMERSDKEGTMIIPIYIDSYGGNAYALSKMIATMDEVPNRFITAAYGKAMSCGAILLSHGDLRFVDKYASVMIHNVSASAWGDVFDMKSRSEEMMRVNKMFIGLLAKNCGKTYEELQDLIKSQTDSKEIWLQADEAVKFGIADKVGVPEMVPIIQWACEARPEKQRLDLHAKAINKKTIKKKRR
jgi:ATP-dependent protease ClpP protease subunit